MIEYNIGTIKVDKDLNLLEVDSHYSDFGVNLFLINFFVFLLYMYESLNKTLNCYAYFSTFKNGTLYKDSEPFKFSTLC